MTAILTLLCAAAIPKQAELAAPQITNPLPVLKGQIGKGKTRASASSSGYSPLNPARLPGVSFALKAAESRTPSVQASPSSQGPNSAFDSALDQLFGKSAPQELGRRGDSIPGHDVTVSSEVSAAPVNGDQEEKNL